MAEIKSNVNCIKGIQYLQHQLKQLELMDILYSFLLLNINYGSIICIELGCKQKKIPQYENHSQLEIVIDEKQDEIELYLMLGKSNPTNMFTEKITMFNIIYEMLLDHMVRQRNIFGIHFILGKAVNSRLGGWLS